MMALDHGGPPMYNGPPDMGPTSMGGGPLGFMPEEMDMLNIDDPNYGFGNPPM